MSIIEQIERGEAKVRLKRLSDGGLQIFPVDDTQSARDVFQDVAEEAISEARAEGRHVISHESKRGNDGYDTVVIGPNA